MVLASRPYAVDVLLVSTASNIGGMERVVCGLAREFEHHRRSTVTVFPAGSRDDELLAWCQDQGVTAAALEEVRDAADTHRWRDVAALRRLVRQVRPAVVNLHYGDNFISLKDVLAVRLAGRQRCVVSVHHPTAWDRRAWKKRILTRVASWLAHDVTTFSQATENVLRDAGVRKSHLRVIPCGVAPPTVFPGKQPARESFGLPADSIVVGFLARHVQHKRLDLLLESLAALADDRVRLLVAGDGPKRAEWEEMARAVLGDRATFTGRLQSTEEFYAACDVFALPSELEGFGLVYVEAAFHGVPSVGTCVGGVPDAVIDGQTGILVPPGDASKLREALHRLLADTRLRQRMGAEARKRATAELTEAAMAERFEQVFRLPQRSP